MGGGVLIVHMFPANQRKLSLSGPMVVFGYGRKARMLSNEWMLWPLVR